MLLNCQIQPRLKCQKCSKPHFYRFGQVLHAKMCGMERAQRKFCHFCQTRYKTNESLKKHLIRDHLISTEKYDEFKCPLGFCKFLGYSGDHLRRHILNVHIEENDASEGSESDSDLKVSDYKTEDDVEIIKLEFDSDAEKSKDHRKLDNKKLRKKHFKRLMQLTYDKNGKEYAIKQCDICNFSTERYTSLRHGFGKSVLKKTRLKLTGLSKTN